MSRARTWPDVQELTNWQQPPKDEAERVLHAACLLCRILRQEWTLHHGDAVRWLRAGYGDEFVLATEEGGWSIDRRVLRHFKRLREGSVVRYQNRRMKWVLRKRGQRVPKWDGSSQHPKGRMRFAAHIVRPWHR